MQQTKHPITRLLQPGGLSKVKTRQDRSREKRKEILTFKDNFWDVGFASKKSYLFGK
jgi:hypothetical protein